MSDPTASTPAPPKAKRPWKVILVIALLIPVVFFGLYTWTALHWDYSNGYRSGTLQKFSIRGWTCKTYEGELWQSMMANTGPIDAKVWNFTVRDQSIAKSLDTLVGKDVRVHYTEHRGVPTTCFGETPYYVDSVFPITK